MPILAPTLVDLAKVNNNHNNMASICNSHKVKANRALALSLRAMVSSSLCSNSSRDIRCSLKQPVLVNRQCNRLSSKRLNIQAIRPPRTSRNKTTSNHNRNCSRLSSSNPSHPLRRSRNRKLQASARWQTHSARLQHPSRKDAGLPRLVQKFPVYDFRS